MKKIHEKNIIDYINKKINNIDNSKDIKLQQYNITIILKFLWELHIVDTKKLQELLIKLQNI